MFDLTRPASEHQNRFYIRMFEALDQHTPAEHTACAGDDWADFHIYPKTTPVIMKPFPVTLDTIRVTSQTFAVTLHAIGATSQPFAVTLLTIRVTFQPVAVTLYRILFNSHTIPVAIKPVL